MVESPGSIALGPPAYDTHAGGGPLPDITSAMAAWKSASVLPSASLKMDAWCSSLPWLTSRSVVRPAASVSGPWNAYSAAVNVTSAAARSVARGAQAAASARADSVDQRVNVASSG